MENTQDQKTIPRLKGTKFIDHYHTCRIADITIGATSHSSIPCWSMTEFGCIQTRYRAEVACIIEREARQKGVDTLQLVDDYIKRFGDPFDETPDNELTAKDNAILLAFGTDAEVVQYYLDQPLSPLEKENRISKAMQWLSERQKIKE